MVDTPRGRISSTTISPNTGQDVYIIGGAAGGPGTPGSGGLQNLSVKASGNRSATTSATDLSVTGTGLNAATTYILLVNQGSVEVRVRVNTSPTTSIGYDLQPSETYGRPIHTDDTIEGITASSSATIFVEEYGAP